MQKLRPGAPRLPKGGNDLTGICYGGGEDVSHCRLTSLGYGPLAFSDEAFNIEHSDLPKPTLSGWPGDPATCTRVCLLSDRFCNCESAGITRASDLPFAHQLHWLHL